MAGSGLDQQVSPRLENLVPGTRVRGVLPDRVVTVVQAEWHGTQAMTLTYRDDAGKVDHELLAARDQINKKGADPTKTASTVVPAVNALSKQANAIWRRVGLYACAG